MDEETMIKEEDRVINLDEVEEVKKKANPTNRLNVNAGIFLAGIVGMIMVIAFSSVDLSKSNAGFTPVYF